MYKSVDIGKRIKTQRELLGITREVCYLENKTYLQALKPSMEEEDIV